MKRAVIYARLSEVRKGDTEGIDRQLREGRAHAERLDVDVVEELVDNDVTASKKTRRAEFERLMLGIAGNEWEVVVLRSLDRWVRRPAELERIIEVVEASKVRVEAIHGEIDLRTRQGRMSARILTSVAMNEAEAIEERVLDWHADRAARGVALHGPPGYGYRRELGSHDVAVDDAEAARIREAAARILAGDTLRAIARDWTDAEVPSTGSEWRAGAIRRILVAPRTAGLRVHRGDVVAAAQWPPILDRGTYDAVVKVLTSPARRTKTVDARRKLLTGLLTCGKPECGRPLNAKPMRGVRRYYCRWCHGTMITADLCEKLVAAMVIDAVDQPAFGRTLDQHAHGRDVVADAVEAIDALERDLETLAAELGDGRMTVPEWKAARAGIERRIAEHRAELEQHRAGDVLAPWVGRAGALRIAWDADDGLTVPAKRAIVVAVFESLTVVAARPGWNRFDPERVVPKWRTST